MVDLLTDADVREIVATWDPRLRVERITAPPRGYVNEVRVVHTAGPTLVVKALGDTWKGPKEAALHAHFRAIGVPAPQVLVERPGGHGVPYPWLVTEFAPGTPWSQLETGLGLDVVTGLYRQLGDLQGRIHTTVLGGFGDPMAGEDGLVAGPVPEMGGVGPFATWVELHDVFVAHRLDSLRQGPLADLAPGLERYLGEHRHLIAGEVTPRLLHLDLHRGNIMVANGRITALLDGEESISGDSAYDLMRTELAHFQEAPSAWREAFREGYREHLPVGDVDPERDRFYEVSRSLVWIKSLAAPGRAGQDRALAEGQVRRSVGALLAGG